MNKAKRTWKWSMVMAALLALVFSMNVLASGLSGDNSLSGLGLHNGTLEGEFVYSTWEYNVTVEPGTTELYLEPTTSNPNASVTSITGTVLENGEGTVLINTVAEDGTPMTYTLHVSTAEGAVGETEGTSEGSTEAQTETQATEPVTEAQTETQAETQDNTVTILQAQVDKLKSNTDLTMKIIYGLIALAVILLFIIINLILKNRDLKDDLKDAEDQLAYQTNEFARKEKSLATDNYYAPVQQEKAPAPAPKEPVREAEPAVEETFGSAQPAPSRERTPDPEKAEGKDVDITMVDL